MTAGEGRLRPSLASFVSLIAYRHRASRAVLRGETCRLSPQAPLSLRRGPRPARPFRPVDGRCRDFPKQDGEEDHLRYALMLRAFAPDDRPLLRRARRLIVRVPSMSVPFSHGHPGTSRRRLASASPTKSAWTSRCSSGADHRPEPMIAVALSGDSQQHWRLGHGGQADLVGDGRIGYWYTNSRFARGASRLRGEQGFPGLSFFRRNEAMRERVEGSRGADSFGQTAFGRREKQQQLGGQAVAPTSEWSNPPIGGSPIQQARECANRRVRVCVNRCIDV